MRDELLTEKPNGKVRYIDYDVDLKMGFFKAHPNLFPEEIAALKIYDGVVIDGTGLGHIAVSEFDEYTKINKKNLVEVKKLQKKTKVAVGVQTVYGPVCMNVYSSGRYLLETGVYGNDMNLTTESMFLRMAYCLSRDKKGFDKLWKKNLEGFDVRCADVEFE